MRMIRGPRALNWVHCCLCLAAQVKLYGLDDWAVDLGKMLAGAKVSTSLFASKKGNTYDFYAGAAFKDLNFGEVIKGLPEQMQNILSSMIDTSSVVSGSINVSLGP